MMGWAQEDDAQEEEQRVLLILIYILCLWLAVPPHWSMKPSVGCRGGRLILRTQRLIHGTSLLIHKKKSRNCGTSEIFLKLSLSVPLFLLLGLLLSNLPSSTSLIFFLITQSPLDRK